MLVLDTSAISAAMHRLPEVLDRLADLDPAELVICTPAAAEIRFGLDRLPAGSRRRRLLEREFDLLREATRWSDWTAPASVAFGQIKADLEGSGRRIDDIDVAIASVAVELGAGVATLNVRHFERVEGLRVEDWGS